MKVDFSPVVSQHRIYFVFSGGSTGCSSDSVSPGSVSLGHWISSALCAALHWCENLWGCAGLGDADLK